MTGRWDLTPFYASFADAAYVDDRAALRSAVQRFGASVKKMEEDASVWFRACVEALDEACDRYGQLASYAYCRYTTDTTDAQAQAELPSIEGDFVPLHASRAVFRVKLAEAAPTLRASTDPYVRERLFLIDEETRLASHQMAPELEELAGDLCRSGGDSWSRLQQALSAGLVCGWENGETKTVVELFGLRHHPDRDVREKAFRKELALWKSAEVPIAFALNGVKGHSVAVNARRHHESTLERSLLQNRVTRRALDALWEAVEESLPAFRAHLRVKAKALGVAEGRLAFHDLFAALPVRPGAVDKVWTYDEARAFIVDGFDGFSKDMGKLARRAFAEHWIDWEQRQGKIGGAYCTDFALGGQCRILANFLGSDRDVSTLAHELGHAYHHEVLKEMSATRRQYPMTLAETASIFAENVIFRRTSETAAPAARAGVLSSYLDGATQVIVDIYSRFLFEDGVMNIRKDRELAPDEFSALMIDAQKRTYGDVMAEDGLHPHMWAMKSHYYDPNYAYYNYPYAFGLLFGLALFAQWQDEGAAFAPRYVELLRRTGTADCRTVTQSVGCDIEETAFWRRGLTLVQERMRDFAAIAGGT